MPLDAHGNYLSGVSGSGVWLNGAPVQPSPNGWPAFWPTGYIFNAEFEASKWNIETEAGMVLSVQGAAPLYAGGGVWLAALLGGSPCARSSWGLALPAMPLGVAPSGRLFTTIGPYPGDAKGIAAYDPDNYTPVWAMQDTSVMPGPANFFALDNDRLIWLNGGLSLESAGFTSQPAKVAEALQIASAPMMVQEATTGVWSAYVTQSGRGVCHPYGDASKGFQAPANAFGFTVWSPGPGELELCWTGNLGQAGPVTRVRVNVADAYPLSLAPEPGPEPIPPHPEPGPEPEPPNPEPPDPPTPEPGPEPQPPQETPVMDIAFDLEKLGFNQVPQLNQIVKVVPHPDGHGLSALQYPDGGYASYGGTWDVHKPSAGAWERFLVPASGQGAITAYRDGGVTSAFPCVPVVVLG